jgi:hypothetical protein|eukprot:COSAG06_NODE_2534_length_6710_cov_23.487521_12_plen_57_part_00
MQITALLSPNHDVNDAPDAGDDIERYVAHNETWLRGMAELRAVRKRRLLGPFFALT